MTQILHLKNNISCGLTLIPTAGGWGQIPPALPKALYRRRCMCHILGNVLWYLVTFQNTSTAVWSHSLLGSSLTQLGSTEGVARPVHYIYIERKKRSLSTAPAYPRTPWSPPTFALTGSLGSAPQHWRPAAAQTKAEKVSRGVKTFIVLGWVAELVNRIITSKPKTRWRDW